MKKISLAILASAALFAGCQSMPQTDPVVEDVKAAFKKDEYVNKMSDKVKVTNEDGKVTLTGTVDNDFQQYQFGATAKGVKGVKSVDNKIKVD